MRPRNLSAIAITYDVFPGRFFVGILPCPVLSLPPPPSLPLTLSPSLPLSLSLYYHAVCVSLCLRLAVRRSTSLCALNVLFLRKTATCVLTQKTGGGLHTSSAACYEPSTDGCVVERWENQSILAIVVVFGCSL